MKKIILALVIACAGVLVVSSCSGETTQAPVTEPPTTVEETTTTVKPAETRPPASYTNTPTPTGNYDPQAYNDAIFTTAYSFWTMFDDSVLLNMGLLVCDTFDAGASLEDVSGVMVQSMIDSGMYTPEIMNGLAAVAAAAALYLCPEYQYKFQ